MRILTKPDVHSNRKLASAAHGSQRLSRPSALASDSANLVTRRARSAGKSILENYGRNGAFTRTLHSARSHSSSQFWNGSNLTQFTTKPPLSVRSMTA